MRTSAQLAKAVRLGAVVAVFCWAGAVASAHAFTITNSDPELRAKVSVDYWLRWVKPGESVVFHAESFPVTVFVQFPLGTLSCDATSDTDAIVLSTDQCLVNGEPAGQTTLRF